MSRKLILILLFSIAVSFHSKGWAEEFIQVPAAIHISSTVSDGKHTIPEIVAIAKQSNLKAVILTDDVLMRWEYGLWPLRRIIKKTVEQKSIFKYGIKKYLNQIENVQKESPDLLLLAGFECAPFYYWEGNVFNSSLKMRNWHKHILAMGLENVKDWENLPVLGNNQGLLLPFHFKNIINFWPFVILLTGILCLNKKKFSYADFRGRKLGPYSRRWRALGALLIIIGLFFSFNNYPFLDFRFDQYHGDLGIMPYQNLIDYINQRGGLTFWAHPEAKNNQEIDGMKILTEENTSDLPLVSNYTGFAIFYEGYNKVGIPGGIWDDMLKQYCQGKRKTPVWIIAGLSFDSERNLSDYMKDLRNILLVPRLSKSEVLRALRDGRMYVVNGTASAQFILDKFVIGDDSIAAGKIMGQELELEGKPRLEISGHFLDGRSQLFKIKLIRNGRIIEILEANSPFNLSYQDEYDGKDKKIYYRIDAESQGLHIVTNPIFIKQKDKKILAVSGK